MNGANVHQASGLSQKRVGEIIQGGSAVHQTSKMVSVEILFSDLKINDTPSKRQSLTIRIIGIWQVCESAHINLCGFTKTSYITVRLSSLEQEGLT